MLLKRVREKKQVRFSDRGLALTQYFHILPFSPGKSDILGPRGNAFSRRDDVMGPSRFLPPPTPPDF